MNNSKIVNDLIDIYAYLVNRLTEKAMVKDSIFSIVGDYHPSFGIKWYIQHEGQLHGIDHELGVSENNFTTYEEAEVKLIDFLVKWITADEINLGAIKQYLTEEDKESLFKFYEIREKIEKASA